MSVLPSPGGLAQASTTIVGDRLRCPRSIRTRGGGSQPSGNALDGIQLPASQQQQRQRWQRPAMAVDDGVEVDSGSKEATPAAEGGWGKQDEDGNVSYARMLQFILPTLGIWLASPIMSLVDAGVVGECLGGGRT